MARTDLTQEIDGAFADRNVGSRHFSDIARSGNGDMRTDLADTQDDYEEYPGLGEVIEPMAQNESATLDAQGAAAPAIQPFRYAQPGEVPPFAPKAGSAWVRKRTPTGTRAPGGPRLVKTTWAQVNGPRLNQLQLSGAIGDGSGGSLPGMSGMGALSMPSTSTLVEIGVGLLAGGLIWFLLKKKKSA
jgi:hypothetical protein